MRRLLITGIVFLLIFPSFLFSVDTAHAAPTETFIGDITVDPSAVIEDGKPTSNEFLSSEKELVYTTIDVNQSGVTNVVIRFADGRPDQQLTNVGGNSWQIGTIRGTAIDVNNNYVYISPRYILLV